MIFPPHYFNRHDIVVASVGLVTNLLLLRCIQKRTSPVFKHYGRLVLLSCVNDIIYSVVILLCQRIIELRNGSMYHMGYGVEERAPHWFAVLLEFAEEVVVSQSINLLPTQYYYRYVLISGCRQPTAALLLGVLLCSTMGSVIFGTLDLWTYYDAQKRGRNYYIKELGSEWADANGKVHFISANDIHDISARVHFGVGNLFVTIAYSVALFYGYKTFHLLRSPLPGLSASTRAMTRQFTRNLMLQTAVAIVCAVVPGSFICTYILVGPTSPIFNGIGPFTSSMFTWTPAANAVVAMVVIRPYRHYVLEIFGIRKVGESKHGPSSFTTTRAVSTTQAEESRGA